MTNQERGLASIAIPAISTGIFGFPKERGANIIVGVAVDFCAANEDTSLREIRFTIIDLATLEVVMSPDRLMAMGAVIFRSTGLHPDGKPFERNGRATWIAARPMPLPSIMD